MPHNDRALKLLQKQKVGGGSWYSFKAKDGGPVDVLIYDEIGGWGISAEQFIKDLSTFKGRELNVRLNTPGGSVFDGNAIYNALKNHDGKVIASVDGLAASIGSVIALAGDSLAMAKNSYFMVHNPWVMSIGTADDMRKTADLLDKMGASFAAIYAGKSGKTPEEAAKWMSDTTWFTADEAFAAGLCDVVGEPMRVAACFDLSVYGYAGIPEGLAPRDVLQMCAAGKAHAMSLVGAGKVDKDSGWSFSAEDGNKILGDPPDWTEYSRWHLGQETDEPTDSKARYKYPFGKDGKVFRSGVIAAKQRAAQQGATMIEAAADMILQEIDKPAKASNEATPPDFTKKWRNLGLLSMGAKE